MAKNTKQIEKEIEGMSHYILVNKRIKSVSLMVWAKWFSRGEKDRIVKQENVGVYWISTVFMGIDHSFGIGTRKMFETMIFNQAKNGESGEIFGRCGTYRQAETMHSKAVEFIKSGNTLADL